MRKVVLSLLASFLLVVATSAQRGCKPSLSIGCVVTSFLKIASSRPHYIRDAERWQIWGITTDDE